MRRLSIESRMARSKGWPLRVVVVAMVGSLDCFGVAGIYFLLWVEAVKLRRVFFAKQCRERVAVRVKLQKSSIHVFLPN